MAGPREEALKRFFQQYARASLQGDTEAICAAFAPSYIESSPHSFAAWKIDETYRAALRARHTMLHDKLGLKNLEADVTAVDEVAPLHYLVPVRWTMTFARPAGDIVSTFLISYIMKVNGQTQILAYISHESEEAVMRRDGVI